MGRRSLFALAGWFAAAVLATLVGLAAIRVIGDGFTSGEAETRSAAEVARALGDAGIGTSGAPGDNLPSSSADGRSAGPSAGGSPSGESGPAPDDSPSGRSPTTVAGSPPMDPTSSAPAPTRTSASSPATGGPAPVSRTFRTPGGVVRAECTGPTVRLVSWAPAPGYGVHNVDRGPRREADVEFRGDRGEVKVEVTCSTGVPVAQQEIKD